ncbi:hypothetical protein AX14_001852 [Amanita brunnescens Koide BX004]|nr:hypothetical protein AX14_001852 [Amanita brunnescens Koide BX004]
MSPIALEKTTAAVLRGPKDLAIEERTLYRPPPGSCQLKVVATGLCGSDLHYYKHGRNGDFAVRAPLVLGHESAGIITQVGPEVSQFKPGQRVAIECGIKCRKCDFCLKGRYNLCRNMRFCSSASVYPHQDGTLQRIMNHPAHVLHPIPDNVSYEQAALAEPLSVLIHASRRAQITEGQTVLVFGVGTIGILACAIAKAHNAARVVAIDINQTRLDFAVSNGFASQTYCLARTEPAKSPDDQLRHAKELAQQALSHFGEPQGFDVVFECTGAESAIQMSINAAMAGGKVMLIGMGTRNIMLPLSTAALREVDIQGSFRYCNTYPEALQLLSSGELGNVEKLITHRFKLEDTASAFDLLSRGQDDQGNMVLKVMIGSS